ncbi:MAG: SDR family NAD(P)-dependent oxidoreductase [Chitinophagaceae bacterium]
MAKTVFITGATSGFGKAMAHRFSREGYRVVITGRRQPRLAELEKELIAQQCAGVKTLCFDVRERKACFEAVAALPQDWQTIDILINNAGLAAGRDLFEEALLEDWETMIDTNIKGLLYITRAIVPLMIRQSRGHIINIGSIAGKEVYERGNVYCATKAAVDALSQAMRSDLLRHQIKVTAIHPGAAATEFSLVRFKGDPEKAAKVYEGYTPLSAEDIADITFYTASLPAHLCINDLVVTPTAQANSFYLLRK